VFTIGDYDLQIASSYFNSTITESMIHWNPLIEVDYWTLSLDQATMGDFQIPISSKEAIVDTGTSYILMPHNDLQSLLGHWSKNMTCSLD